MAKKPDWLFKQAGALPYRHNGEQLEVVLITSRSSGKWIVPKGVIDPGETPESTAVKEAYEEAGVVGTIAGEVLGFFDQPKWGGVARVEVFPMEVKEILDDWDEQSTRNRFIGSLDEARQVASERIVEILDGFERFLEAG